MKVLTVMLCELHPSPPARAASPTASREKRWKNQQLAEVATK
jgi:hypothetical protein